MSDNEKKYLYLRLEDEKVDISDEETVMPEHSLLMKNGRYYWIAELPMGKSFFLLFEVWRALGIAGLAVLFISFIISLLSGSITSFQHSRSHTPVYRHHPCPFYPFLLHRHQSQ